MKKIILKNKKFAIGAGLWIVGGLLLAKPAIAETSQVQVSDGTAITLEKLGMTIVPPKGWEVDTQTAGISVLMQEPKAEDSKVVEEKTKYRRNITVATIHEPSAIDESRAQKLTKELEEKFGKNPLVSQFQVLPDHKFFNYRGQNDGLIMYSSMKLGEFSMMQMHILVSGSEKQFLSTYTDLADSFSKPENSAYETAWNAMTSLQVKGEAPKRYEEWIPYAAFGGSALVCFFVLLFFIRRRSSVNYDQYVDAIYKEDHKADGEDDEPLTSTFATNVSTFGKTNMAATFF